MHLQSQNYVEAALTLKLHADLHTWDLNSFAPPMEDLGLPQQSQFHRKETLCLLILDYLGRRLCSCQPGIRIECLLQGKVRHGRLPTNLQRSRHEAPRDYLQLVREVTHLLSRVILIPS